MANTSDRILDTAEALIQQGGFHAFSFQDVADRVGIKKASVYYHHPAKAELGREVIARYRQRFQEILTAIEEDCDLDYWEALDLYLAPIVELARAEDQACLCGVLCGEYVGLPDGMRDEIAAFFNDQHAWLTTFLELGRKAGAFRFDGPPARMAKLMFSAIEGALLIKRATQDDEHLDDVLAMLKGHLKG